MYLGKVRVELESFYNDILSKSATILRRTPINGGGVGRGRRYSVITL